MPHGWPDYVAFETPVTVPQGGTGAGSWTAGGVILGNGTGPLVASAAGFGDGARVYHDVAQAIDSGITTVLSFNSERYDNGGLHDTVTNNSRLTAQRAGKYTVSGHVMFGASGVGIREIGIRRNNLNTVAMMFGPSSAEYQTPIAVSTVLHLAAGDYLELWVFQNSGGSLNVLPIAELTPEFAMQWIGP